MSFRPIELVQFDLNTLDLSSLPDADRATARIQAEAVFEILNDWLQPGSSMPEVKVAAAIIAELEPLPLGYHPLNFVVLELCQLIPYYNPMHLKLAKLMVTIGRNSFRALGAKGAASSPTLFHSQFAADMDVRHPDPTRANMPIAETIRFQRAYVSYTAFKICLFAAGFLKADARPAIFSFQQAFSGSEIDPELHGIWILIAAQWVLLYGPELFKLTFYTPEVYDPSLRDHPETQQIGPFRAPRPEEGEAISVAVWNKWKERMHKAELDYQLDRYIVTQAQKACAYMQAIQSALTADKIAT